MNTMPLHEAWSALGKDAKAIMKEVSQLPRAARPTALRRWADESKRLAKSLAVKHHPDRGGDAGEFRRIQDALVVIEHHTKEFERQAAELAEHAAEAASRRPVFIDVKK